MPEFIPGLELARLFYEEGVRPILQADYPQLMYSAGLLETGSEVLGFDDAMSSDHNWGPRLFVYLSQDDLDALAEDISERLAWQMPAEIRGMPTHFVESADDSRTFWTSPSDSRPLNHRVYFKNLEQALVDYTGAKLDTVTTLDWLTIPEQKLRTLSTGGVFHDDLNILHPLQARLAYYPSELWLYLLSAQWQRIGQEEPFVGRAGYVGDEIGSAVIAGRLVRDLMRLGFLMEKSYAPYPKWFGTGFARLACAESLKPHLEAVLTAGSWQDRQERLAAAYRIVAQMHNELGITEPISEEVTGFHDRPFLVINGDEVARKLWKVMEDAEVRSLPFGVGKVDQIVDSTDILSHAERCRAFAGLYRRGD